ncbi:uncharacterized protein LOC129774343 [Toxorhynchites rutilus septentrionalis]|uniref:uncharacterized protein LOC129774343 n=1 Tax=Toxorhynchites rutilus septentrionalis TaxID=329112 RepID=UPI00247A9A13|nr:uncharacterized protein LOC129774343 [Toxorhynchites rutilus septentrionalis]
MSLAVITFHSLIRILRLLGLFPYCFNHSERRFYRSDIAIVYSMLYIAVYAFVFGRYFLETFFFETSTGQQNNQLLLGASFCCAYTAVIVTCLTGLLRRSSICQLLNHYVRLWYRLRGDVRECFDGKLLSRFLFKAIFIDGVVLAGVVVMKMPQFFQAGALASIGDALYEVFDFGISAALTNLFVAAGYLGAHVYRLINRRISRINWQLKQFERNRHYWSVNPKKQCNLHDEMIAELRQLACWHGELSRIVHGYCQMYDISLLLIIIKDFMIIITGLFGMYRALMAQFNGNTNVSLDSYGFLVSLSVFSLCQFYYLVESFTQFTERLLYLWAVLSTYFSFQIEVFSLELLHRDNRIQNCGMFTIDFSLLYVALATMTSYLIVVIQLRMTT